MPRRATTDSPLLFDLPEGPDFLMELAARKAGQWPVAGADEAGRGPLAGPVVAAAVILDPERIPDGLHDSKQLTAAKRTILFEAILKTATVAVASSSARRIDTTDIRKASLDAMRRAVSALPIRPGLVLTDGLDVPPGLCCDGRAVVKGDARVLSIAAASIVAKVVRDRMMTCAETTFPDYGFSAHAGYATERHRDAIGQFGPCALHRMSFRPLRAGEVD
ncbi:ribonuclease HII [Rhizobium sp. ARZ01]|uniref:ribonuclease HII n=1 Tax=Rhizobium sp. ARZ01 TaxID=2769313 RepID=UPI001782B566|nr:ribonuclease HII [Rhizobium sp. ARZ01]MBD9371239.1 ribonuclease HII [Rhizobium sp. ARZ01]